jgi:hypothetical protein
MRLSLAWEESLRRMARAGAGIAVYVRGHEGRGVGLSAKLSAYAIMDHDKSVDTFSAHDILDCRRYDLIEHVLYHEYAVRNATLLTNNARKLHALRRTSARSEALVHDDPPPTAVAYLNAKGILPTPGTKTPDAARVPREVLRHEPPVVASLSAHENDAETSGLVNYAMSRLAERWSGVVPVWSISIDDLARLVKNVAELSSSRVVAIYVVARQVARCGKRHNKGRFE